MNAVASLKTDKASRYLALLCNHFARRLDVTFDDRTGHVEFPFGHCEMTADDDRLELVATAKTIGDLDLLEEIIGNHLERYAFRESPELVWEPAPDAPQKN